MVTSKKVKGKKKKPQRTQVDLERMGYTTTDARRFSQARETIPAAATDDLPVLADDLPSELEMLDEQETELITCPVCHGSKIEELYHGLLSFHCRKCGGTGRIVKPGSGSES